MFLYVYSVSHRQTRTISGMSISIATQVHFVSQNWTTHKHIGSVAGEFICATNLTTLYHLTTYSQLIIKMKLTLSWSVSALISSAAIQAVKIKRNLRLSNHDLDREEYNSDLGVRAMVGLVADKQLIPIKSARPVHHFYVPIDESQLYVNALQPIGGGDLESAKIVSMITLTISSNQTVIW